MPILDERPLITENIRLKVYPGVCILSTEILYYDIFRFSIAKRSNDGRAHFWLLIDEERYFYFNIALDGGSTAPTGTATINIQLTAGQIVRVENNISTLIYGTNSEGIIQSYFTGFLLYLLWTTAENVDSFIFGCPLHWMEINYYHRTNFTLFLSSFLSLTGHIPGK